jgi:hypothetical protein
MAVMALDRLIHHWASELVIVQIAGERVLLDRR